MSLGKVNFLWTQEAAMSAFALPSAIKINRYAHLVLGRMVHWRYLLGLAASFCFGLLMGVETRPGGLYELTFAGAYWVAWGTGAFLNTFVTGWVLGNDVFAPGGSIRQYRRYRRTIYVLVEVALFSLGYWLIA